jgi:hypothetical protein
MRAFLVLIFIVGMTTRVGLIASGPLLHGDAGTRYDPLARNLALGNGFSQAQEPPYTVNDFDQPGYVGLVACSS